MKKDIRNLIIITILLTFITTTVILIGGKKYTINFSTPNNDSEYKIVLDNPDIVEIIKEEKKNNKHKVKLKALKPGRAVITLEHGALSEGRSLHVHKTKIITEDTIIGKSSFSELIPLSISIFLSYSIYILIKKYRKNVKENLYQYRNIAYLGIIIYLSFFTISTFLTIFNYRGLNHTVNSIISSSGVFSILLLPLAIITFILVTISNIHLIIKEGMSLKNLLGLFFGIFVCLSTLLPNYVYGLLMKSQRFDIYNLNGPGPYIYNFVESLVYLTIAYIECILISTIIIAIKSALRKIEHNKDYMIILGCQIKKDGTLTPLLKGRADKAIEFRNKQLEETKKDLIFIASGGKGPNEIISEGEAIKNYLVEQGIPKKNILVDDKSKNTFENIKFSNKLIDKKKANIAFSTTKYHVLRAGLIATSQNLHLEGIGSKTRSYFWINAFIREFIGTIYSEKKKHIIVFLFIIVILILMIYITYIANNT